MRARCYWVMANTGEIEGESACLSVKLLPATINLIRQVYQCNMVNCLCAWHDCLTDTTGTMLRVRYVDVIHGSVRENVFCVFFILKNMTFYIFWNKVLYQKEGSKDLWTVWSVWLITCAGISRHHVCLCVCLCVTRRYCIKTAKRRITQTTPRDSAVTLVFWRHEPLVNDPPFPLKFALKVTRPFLTAQFRPIFAHSASTVRASKKSSISTNRKSTTRDSPGTLAFWRQESLVDDPPFPLKFALEVTHPLSNTKILTNIRS